MLDNALVPFQFWLLVTRLGEAQILLPTALLALVWLARRDAGRPLAAWWLGLAGLAVLLTTASKVAFMGWGLGSAGLNFTGISGHAMFAAAVLPLLVGMLASPLQPRERRLALVGAYSLALLVGVSRIKVGAHSSSEVLAGLLVGGAASAVALALAHVPVATIRRSIPLALLAWLAVTPIHAPASRTHDWVTRLSLALSGRSAPYTRGELLRERYDRQASPLSQGGPREALPQVADPPRS